MRILHVNKRYPPHVGGVEAHVRDLARAESAHDGITVEVLAVSEGAPVDERDGEVVVHRVSEWGTVASNPLSVEIARFLSHSDHDLWHFHYPFPTGEASFLIERRRRKTPPAVVTYHSDTVGSGLKGMLLPAYRSLTRRFLEAVDAVVVSSPQVLQHSALLQAVSRKVHVIPFGIDAAHLARTPASVARAKEVRVRLGTPLLLFVGRLVPYKGVEVLLRALPHVPAPAVIVGDGPLRDSLQGLSRTLGLEERVHFVGAVDDAALAAYFQAADVFVLPSVTRNEAFGLVQLEAHACGVPVVSTALHSGVPFANQHGVSGLIVPPGDVAGLAAALSLLVEDEPLRRRLGHQARDRFEREFSLPVMTDRVLALYGSLGVAAPRQE